MSATVYSWLGIESEKLNTEFTVTSGDSVKSYTVSYNTDLVVNMSFQGKEAHADNSNGVNAQGWTRDKDYYWSQLIETHPEYFSSNNMYKIQQLGYSLVVDDTFIKYFPEYSVVKVHFLKFFVIGVFVIFSIITFKLHNM